MNVSVVSLRVERSVVLPAAAVRIRRGTATPVDGARLDDVTTEHLGGASPFEVDAFGVAVMEDLLDAQVDPWTALAVAWDGGAWQFAQRLTAEARQPGPRDRRRKAP
jgi:hypothetical protein